YPVSITATSGSLTHIVTVTLNVGDFSVSATPGSRSVLPGGSAGYTVAATALNGFVDSVEFSATGLPTGVTAGFSPATIAGTGSTTLTLTTTATTPPGVYPVTITGTSGTLTHTATITLN